LVILLRGEELMKRFSIVSNGYNVNEVNKFIDVVIKKLEQLNHENEDLKVKISSLEKKLDEAENIDEKLAKAIIAVQETSDRMKELAKAESRTIIEDAKRNANAIVHEALINAEKTESEALLLQKNITIYKNRVKNLIKSQLEIAEDLDKIELEK